MNKFNKIMTAVLVIITIITAANIFVSAATGDNLVTIVKEIIENHLFYVDDVQVTEAEYNAMISENHNESVTVDVEHRVYTEVVYKINGEVVSATEYSDYLEGKTATPTTPVETPKATEVKGSNEIVITEKDLTGLNSGSIGDYLTFETNSYDEIISATVKSDKVVGIKYTYSDSYLSYTSQDNDCNLVYTSNTYGAVYPDLDKDSNGNYFTYGQPAVNTNGFLVADEDGVKTVAVEKGDYVFQFDYPHNVAPITFGFVYKSITLILE